MTTILDHIGNTPLVRLQRIPESLGIDYEIWVKCEFFSAGGSIKDRIALRMIEQAEKQGRLTKDSVIIEPTSGNTGIGLALVGAVKGYRTIIVLPEKMSAEKVSVLRALGAEIIRTPTEAAWDSPESHISVARRLRDEIPGGIILDQYANPDNPLAHELGTAQEIYRQSDGEIDLLVAGAGTGGSITGLSRGLKYRIPHMKVVAVDPVGSILALPASLNTDTETGYQVEGIGYDFVPKVLDRSSNIIDKWIKTSDTESLRMARRMIREEGLLCGGSSGSAMVGAIQAAKEYGLGKGHKVVVILPDSIRSYLSKFVSDDWMKEHDFLPSQDSSVSNHGIGMNRETHGKHHTNGTDTIAVQRGTATVADLKLPDAVCLLSTTLISDAIRIMTDRDISQVPVLSPLSQKLVGLLTLSKLLSSVSNSSQATAPDNAVESVMFRAKPKGRKFMQITVGTKLTDLKTFFETNSYGIVTGEGDGSSVLHVITNVDVLEFMVRQSRIF